MAMSNLDMAAICIGGCALFVAAVYGFAWLWEWWERRSRNRLVPVEPEQVDTDHDTVYGVGFKPHKENNMNTNDVLVQVAIDVDDLNDDMYAEGGVIDGVLTRIEELEATSDLQTQSLQVNLGIVTGLLERIHVLEAANRLAAYCVGKVIDRIEANESDIETLTDTGYIFTEILEAARQRFEGVEYRLDEVEDWQAGF